MDENSKEKVKQPEDSEKAAIHSVEKDFCTKPFDSENSRIGEEDEPCENSER